MSWVKSRSGEVAVNLANVVSLELEETHYRAANKGGPLHVLRAFASTRPHEGVVLAAGLTEKAGQGLLKLLMILPAGENIDLGNLGEGKGRVEL